MNERIRELAEQAGMVKILDEHANEYGAGMLENYPYPELERFAELIVQKCVSIVAERKDQAIDDGCNVDEAMSMAGMDLLDHFGVEL
jgi:hypothetical protein